MKMIDELRAEGREVVVPFPGVGKRAGRKKQPVSLNVRWDILRFKLGAVFDIQVNDLARTDIQLQPSLLD